MAKGQTNVRIHLFINTENTDHKSYGKFFHFISGFVCFYFLFGLHIFSVVHLDLQMPRGGFYLTFLRSGSRAELWVSGLRGELQAGWI